MTADSDLNNKRIIEKVARKSYIPTTTLLLEFSSDIIVSCQLFLFRRCLGTARRYAPER